MDSLNVTYFRFLYLQLGVVLFFFSCSSGPSGTDPVIDPGTVKTSSVSVIDVSGKTGIPSVYKIDGLLSSNVMQAVGSGKVVSNYVPVEAGLRKLSIGNFNDTIRIKEANYYTVMLHDKDSLSLSLDAPYSSNKFNTGPQVRWTIGNEDPASYRVAIKSDTVFMNDIKANTFVATSMELSDAVLYLYRRGEEKELLNTKVPTKLNSKETVKFVKATTGNSYSVEIFSQQVKP